MLLLELSLIFSGVLGCVLTYWTPEFMIMLPGFVQKLFINSYALTYLLNSLKLAGYLGIVFMLLNLLSGNRKWWKSRISVAISIVYFYYAWNIVF